MTDQPLFQPRFGAVLDDGGVTFRLWAPDRARVELAIDGRPPAPMELHDGVAELRVAGAGPGDRYSFVLDGATRVPDPASRFQPEGVHGPSEVVDLRSFAWKTNGWRGRPWEQAVVYELHLGTFTAEGTSLAAIERLDDLVALGVTAIELMPVAAASGTRGWGYDGVQIYAPHLAYGRPEDLARLVDEAHARGLAVMLDVVYNHFGPEGNYIGAHASPMFAKDAHTPWGSAIAVDGPDRETVRRFFIDNALQWLCDYRFDGLRLDAVNTLSQDSEPTFLDQLAAEVRAAARADAREIYLVLENDDNQSRFLSPGAYTAQWNDDVHHALHSLITGEADGYYGDYQPPLSHLGRCLAEGFAYQGEPSPYRGGKRRGEPSAALSPSAFVSFLQNHDQVGNRAMGERVDRVVESPEALTAAEAVILLSPQIPLLFMGQEWRASTPFLFFCDHGDRRLKDAVREGRRREFARFAAFADPEARARIPDPNDERTFAASKLDWSERERPPHREALARTTELLQIRAASIAPLIGSLGPGAARVEGGLLEVRWPIAGGDDRGGALVMALNSGREPLERPERAGERIIAAANGATASALPPWGVLVTAERPA